MALISIVPICGGHCGIVVVYTTDGVHRIVDAQSIEIGSLVALPENIGGRDKRRDITEADLLHLGVVIRDTVHRFAVTNAVIENPSKSSKVATRVDELILSSLELDSVPVEPVFSAWRNALGEPQNRRTNCRLSAIAAFGEECEARLEYDSIRFSAALAAYVLGGGEQVAQKSFVPKVVAGSVDLPETPESIVAENGHYSMTVSRKTPEGGEEILADSGPVLDPGVSAGIDVGIRFLGLAIARGKLAPLRLLHLETIDVGETVQLAKPKTIECADGRTYQITTKRVVTRENIHEVSRRVIEILREYGVSKVTIEDAYTVHPNMFGDINAHSLAASIATGAALLTEQKLAMAIEVRAMDTLGICVDQVFATSWRAKVCKRLGPGGDGAKDIPRAVAMGFSNWPQTSNDHTRDAGGILLYGRIPDEAKRLTGKGRTTAASPIARLQESAAMIAVRKAALNERARAAQGCVCKSKKHRRECPLFKPRVSDWVRRQLENT